MDCITSLLNRKRNRKIRVLKIRLACIQRSLKVLEEATNQIGLEYEFWEKSSRGTYPPRNSDIGFFLYDELGGLKSQMKRWKEDEVDIQKKLEKLENGF